MNTSDNFNNVLFCDIDGCLHEGGAFLDQEGNPISEFGAGVKLLSQQNYLEAVLRDFPNVKIVISSNWVGIIGYEKTKSYFSPFLQEKIIGSTFDGSIPFDEWRDQYRGDQILEFIHSNKVKNWVALDDRSDGFQVKEFDHKHVQPNEYEGIATQITFTELFNAFELNFKELNLNNKIKFN